MRSTYDEFGVVRLTNTGLTEAKEMHRYARAVVKKHRVRFVFVFLAILLSGPLV